MGDSPVPEDVLAFIDRTFSSIGQLEILLLLRAHRRRSWSADQVSQELRSNATAAEERLRGLQDAGLVAPVAGADRCYRYQPDTPGLDDLVSRLAECYRDYRLRVIERLFQKRQAPGAPPQPPRP